VQIVKKIRLHDKLKALETLGRWMKMFVDRVEMGNPGEFEQLSDKDLMEEARRTEQRLAKLRERIGQASKTANKAIEKAKKD
jgi:hypothetical protein